MSIIFELFKTSGKKVCPPNYVRKSNCPLFVRTTSEDLLTANVFGILKNLDPKIWLTKFLGEAIKGKDFSCHTFENLSCEFWKRYRPLVNRKYREGVSEVDVTISYKDGVISIKAKYLAPVNLRTTSDPRRDQIIRYLDLAAYHYLNHPDAVKEFYFVLIIDTEKPPWVLTRYRYTGNPYRNQFILIGGWMPYFLPLAQQEILERNRAIVRTFCFWYIFCEDN